MESEHKVDMNTQRLFWAWDFSSEKKNIGVIKNKW